MEEMQLSETEQRYFGDLFTCCDSEKTGKVPIYKASELFRSANLPLDVLKQITEALQIPWRGGCVGRKQFFAALKLIAAYQAGLPLRTDAPAPLPRLGWPVPTSAQTPAGIWEQPQNRTVSPDLIQLSDTDPGLTPHQLQDEATGHAAEGCGDMGALTGQRNGHHSAASSSASSSPSPPPTEPHSLVGTVPEPLPVPLSTGICAGVVPGMTAAVPTPNASAARVVVPEAGRTVARSPEASSTASDSPTPTNSAQERRWAAQQRWHHGALVCEEQRQLLGTEEESSDRHSSDDDAEEDEAAAAAQVWSISSEQKEYYEAQFRSLQSDPQGLVAGPVARLFFEKSRLPVHELRRIWQLSDVTKDGALSLPEFNTAMHLVVLRRNNIALPDVLPPTLIPQPLPATTLMSTSLGTSSQTVPSGASVSSIAHTTGPVHVVGTCTSSPGARSLSSSSSSPGEGVGPPPPSHAPPPGPSASAAAAALVLGTEADADSPPSLSPPADDRRSPAHATHRQGKEWTKFVDSPTSSVSSPGPKPVNFDFHKAAVEQDPKILHPVALRLTPEQMQPSSSDVTNASEEPCRSPRRLAPEVAATSAPVPGAATVPYEPLCGGGSGGGGDASVVTIASPKKTCTDSGGTADIRAIQRPLAKKPTGASGPGMLPPPPSAAVPEDTPMPSAPTSACLVRADSQPAPQGSGGSAVMNIASNSGGLRKEPPPPPPPRPLRSHTRSSSLDLNRLGPVVPGTPPVVPPRISPSTTSPRKLLGQRSEGDVLSLMGPPGSVSAHGPQSDGPFPLGGAFADFSLHFATRNGGSSNSGNSVGGIAPSSGGGGDQPDNGGEQQAPRRHGAFEVYRKPSTSAAPSHLEATSLPDDTVPATQDVPANSTQRGRGATLQRLQEQNWRLARVCAALARELAALAEERAALETRLQQLRGQAPAVPPPAHDDHRSAQWHS